MAARLTLLQAIDLGTKAIEEDQQRNYEVALRLYADSIEYFLYLIKYEVQDEKVQNIFICQCYLYLKRAERIKESLEQDKEEALEKDKEKPLQDEEDTSNADGAQKLCNIKRYDALGDS